MFYSASKNTWYDPQYRSAYEERGAWPTDAVEYDMSVFNEMVVHRYVDQDMQPDANGIPILVSKSGLTLDQVKTDAYSTIDFQAGEARKKYITDVAGQSETYFLKADDARAYKVAGYPVANIALYLFVRAEARSIYGETPTEAQYQLACDYIIETQHAWLQPAADIEEHRRTGKEAVKSATTATDVNTAKGAAISALQAL
jgi:hypothetical protein